MHFSVNSIRKLIRMSVNPRLRIAKTAINELGAILSMEGASIIKIAAEIAGSSKRNIILKEDVVTAYSALFL